uniref:Uncharacterized protein n=1 Tax=Anopheles farauti TaxID=69004 RepID=A0A182QE15_9DIPT
MYCPFGLCRSSRCHVCVAYQACPQHLAHCNMSSNPCKHGDREKDQNNNFVNATAHGGAGIDRETRARRATGRTGTDHDQQLLRTSGRNQQYYHNQQQSPPSVGGQRGEREGGASNNGSGPQVTAKVMWGNVSAIKELREKEQSERQLGTRAAGRRQ